MVSPQDEQLLGGGGPALRAGFDPITPHFSPVSGDITLGPLVSGPTTDEPQVIVERRWYLRGSALKGLCVLTDVVDIFIGLLISYAVTANVHVFGSKSPTRVCLLVGALSLPVWVFIFSRYRLYVARFVGSRLDEFNRLTHGVLAGTLSMAALAFLLHLAIARSWVIGSFFSVMVVGWVGRQAQRRRFRSLRMQGKVCKRVLIVGVNEEAENIYRQLQLHPALGYQVVGLLGEPGQSSDHAPVVGEIDDALAVARRDRAQGLIVASSAVPSVTTNRMAREMTEAGLHVELSSSLWDIGYERLTVRPVGYHPMVYVEPVLRTGWRPVAKRLFDIVVALSILIAVAPLVAVIAVVIKLDSKGPVLFTQTRVGLEKRPFRVLKFRSMVVNAEELLERLRSTNEADGPLFKMRSDPRITRVGGFLRKYSLDELPQLVNVLLGDMSVVGPRPALYEEMAEWTPELRDAKLRVRPGLTGMWQVSGRSNLSFEDYVRLDLFYVYNWSLWRDLSIVARTARVVLRGDGAY